MLVEFRAAVYAQLTDPPSTFTVHPRIPDDIAELPCIVLGRPSAVADITDNVFAPTLDVIVVGNRTDPEGEAELRQLTDDVFGLLGGTRGTRHGSTYLTPQSVNPSFVTVAGLERPAYNIAVDSAFTTC